MTATLIADALDTIRILGWALAAWITALAAAGTLILLAITAAGAGAIRALHRRHTRPSWARSRLRARIHTHTRTRRSSGRTDDPDYDEAA